MDIEQLIKEIQMCKTVLRTQKNMSTSDVEWFKDKLFHARRELAKIIE